MSKACTLTLDIFIVLPSVISDDICVIKEGFTPDVAPLSRIHVGSPIFLNLLLSTLSGVVIDVTGAPYVVVLQSYMDVVFAFLK